MEILEAYDLTGSLRAAAKLAGCDHKTVAHWVRQRELAAMSTLVAERKRPAMSGVFKEKIDELVDRSHGKIRADKAHARLVALGYEGSERTTRRWVAEAKAQWRREHRRRTGDRRPAGGVVLRVAGLVALPGGRSVVGQDVAVGGDGSGPGVSLLRRGPDLCADR